MGQQGRRGLNLSRALFGAVLVVALVGSAAQAAPPSDRLVVAQGTDPVALDVTQHREVPTYNVTMNIFDGLLHKRPDGSFEGGLATSWRRLDDTTWELDLRRGVRFHNGEPFTAEAVRFTLERIVNPDYRSARRTGYLFVQDLEVVDDFRVRLRTTRPYPLTEALLAELQIVPPRYYAQVGPDGFNRHPIGTGPYRFVRWVKDTVVELEANPEYWRGAPAFGRLEFRPIPNPVTRVASLIAGEADVIVNVPPPLIAQVDASTTARVKVVDGARVIYVGLNTKLDSPLKDRRVRQALNYAVDVPSIVKGVLQGLGTPTSTLLTAVDFGFSPDVQPYPYDPARARQLLAEAGYPNGFETTLQTPSGRYLNDLQVAQAIAAQLEAVGVKVKIEVREFGAYNRDLFSGNAGPMFLLGWGNPVFDADYIFYPLLRTGELLSYFSHEGIDRLLDVGHGAVDREVRRRAYREVVPLIHQEAPVIFLYKQRDAYGVSRRVEWEPRSDEFLWMFDARPAAGGR